MDGTAVKQVADFCYLGSCITNTRSYETDTEAPLGKANNTFGRLITTTPQPFYGPFSGTTQVSRCQKRTSGLLWCKGRLTEADAQTIPLGATPSGVTSAHLHHPPIFYRPDALPAAQPTVSKH